MMNAENSEYIYNKMLQKISKHNKNQKVKNSIIYQKIGKSLTSSIVHKRQ
jgi:hypothetical protein